MKRLLVTLDASRDLSEISDYFLEQSVEAGEHFVEGFEKKCKYLAQFPYFGRSYFDISPDLRGITWMNYIIFYQIFDDRIEILRVISGYRDLEEIFNRQ
ncbi:type II toxin-antitoxin system RelE/ParE family toxin [Oscillatoria sp. FACHB-1406]|uniref:type II toxin-antitoxin system RelE/ParE family toxin n=1 Tax=Oscillatoria sp. FACHB-1406 TaxID=2692846 RepID=UPI0016875E0E|nr:type II toxin-antitoxin system RelE/ParE family toxin [Oscillatoria sp. FACHB-1406]MBD2576764.1 type II toxin-antitoxin system RelE/ParE family toxin [Oscillatoria sp. FACHB-1406]